MIDDNPNPNPDDNPSSGNNDPNIQPDNHASAKPVPDIPPQGGYPDPQTPAQENVPATNEASPKGEGVQSDEASPKAEGVQSDEASPKGDVPSGEASPIANDKNRQAIKNIFDNEQEERNQAQSNAQNTLNQPNFARISFEDYNMLKSVYVESDKFTEFYDELPNHVGNKYRMTFIRGERNSGRYATALYLALKLSPDVTQPHIYDYIPELATTSLSLLDILRRATQQSAPIEGEGAPSQPNTGLPRGSIIIIRDMFGAGTGNINQLSKQAVRQLRQILESNDIRLILTTTYPADELVLNEFPIFSTKTADGKFHVDFGAIYDRFLDYDYPTSKPSMSAYRAQLEQMREIVITTLQRPSEIDYFFKRVQSNIPQDEEQLDALLKQLVGDENRRSQTRPWFESLRMNQKLYAIFVVLFRGLKQYDLDELYDFAIDHLRDTMKKEDIPWLDDTRRFSDEELHEVLLLKERRGFLEFRVAHPEAYIEEIERQIANYHRLLGSLADLFKHLIMLLAPDDVQMRRLLATALAYIGEFRPKRLETILDDLAEQSAGHIASSVAFSLAHLARRPDNYNQIIETLRRWTAQKKQQADYLWAAIVSLAQVYEVIGNVAHAPNPANPADQRYAQETLQALRDLLTDLCGLTREIGVSEFADETRQAVEQAIYAALDDSEIAYDPEDTDLKAFIQSETEKYVRIRWVATTDQLSMSIIRTIYQISQKYPDDMVSLLNGWLAQGNRDNFSWQLGRMVSNFLFQPTTIQAGGVVDDRHLSLLKLMPALLDASIHTDTDAHKLLLTILMGGEMIAEGVADHTLQLAKLVSQTPIRTVIQTLEIWYGYLNQMKNSDDTAFRVWHDQIYTHLLHLVNQSGQHTRPMLVKALIDYWLNSPHEEVRRSAMALLTRCYVMDGVVLALPVHRYGAVVLDAGQSANEDYRTRAFDLLQRLATLTPLRIYHLGWIGAWDDVDVRTPLHLGRYEKDVTDFGTITHDDLQLGITHPRLIVPLMEDYPNGFAPIRAHEAHFVLCLNLTMPIDIDELVGDFIGKPSAEVAKNPLLALLDTSKTAEVTPDWAWFGKLFLLGDKPNHLRHMPDDAIHWLGVVDKEATSPIERLLQQHIINELHQTDEADWLEQLRAYRVVEADVPETHDLLWDKLALWVTQLDQVPEVIPPRDMTLTITSAMLLLSKYDMARVVGQVCAWLESDDDLIRHIGRACTKILFNFYRHAPYWDDVDRLAPLLGLCVPFMQCQPKFAEVFPILHTGLEWAKHKAWSDRLLMRDGELSEFIRAFTYLEEREDADAVLNHLKLHETVLRIQSLFMDVGKPKDEFITLIKETMKWADETQQQRQRALQQAQMPPPQSRLARRSGSRPSAQPPVVVYQPIQPPQGISADFANELLEVPNPDGAFGKAVLSEIQRQQHLFLDKNYLRQHRDMRANIQAVIDSTRLQVYNKRTGELPKLPADTRYGVVLVDVSATDPTSRSAFPDYAIRLVNSLHQQSGAMGNKVMMVVHRLGRQELLAILQPSIRKVSLRPDEIIPNGLPAYASLLAPILDAYPAHETQFVAIITNKPAHDWSDIADNMAWRGRVFVVSETHVDLPMGIERIPIISNAPEKDPLENVAESILNKTTRLRSMS